MSIYRLDTDLVVQSGDAQWRVQRVLDDQYVQLENQTTGRIRRERIAKLASDIANKKLTVVRDSRPLPSGESRDGRQMVVCTATLPSQHKAKFERAYAYVRHMRKCGITKGQRARISEAISSVAEKLGDDNPPGTPTVMRWMRFYEKNEGNAASLVPRHTSRRSSRRKEALVLQVIRKVLARHYFVRDGCTLREVHDKVLRKLSEATKDEASEEALVSLSTVQRIARETSPFDRDRARLGTSEARAKWRFAKPGGYATRPLERVEMDHTLLDLVVLDDQLGIPLGRPVITFLVCGFSGYILGFFISFEGETVGRVVQSIKVAVQPKDAITAGQGLVNPWYAMGLWETLVLDNSLSFHSPHIRHVASDLCLDVEYCPVRMPWFKPVVERQLGELTRQLPAQGRPKKPGVSPDPVDPSKSACITFSDLCFGVLQWVVDVHPFEINERKMARPIDLFREGLASCPAPTLMDDTSSLDVLAGLSSTATVDHSGIVHQWIRYASDELGAIRREMGTKFKANIKYNPYDLGSVFVQHPRSGMWTAVEARDREYAAGLTSTQHRLIRKAAEEKLTLANADKVLREARLALQDHWAQAIRGGRRIKRGARELALVQGISSLSPTRLQRKASDAPAIPIVTDTDRAEPDNGEIPTFEVFAGDES
ncbi:Mu transposase C-terminal domain-containing protein [Ralstonia pseudosolanacearum]|uniref:Mu transposase C-terminal domain-containing protein n=1 Tax=Ralstonia pseudosolanacearum TaxID=1310165 RepID=UPI001FFBD35D|nr:Mu transposase C-terminal domain-containing protein [Ralstonia pseudosolanacearum]